jgi:uncharacterized membrane protein
MTTDAAYAPPPPTDDSADKGLALLSYIILFLAPFIAGFPSIISVIIAAVRRGSASPLMRTHYDFQIRIFWIGVLFIALGFACAALALAFGMTVAWSAWGDLPATTAGVGLGVVLLAAAAVTGFLGNFCWMIIASIFGVARLAENRPIGRLPATSSVPTVSL